MQSNRAVRPNENLIPREYDLAESKSQDSGQIVEIRFNLPEDCKVKILITDPIGQEVAILVDDRLVAGRYQRMWQRKDRTGKAVRPGQYYLRMDATQLKGDPKLISLRKTVLVE